MDDKKRIIVIEDDDVLRDVLSEKLERSGYIVERAEDGVVAMEKLHANKPDLILLDILMPRKGGLEVLEEVHADPILRTVPVIIISNSGQPVEVARAQELGAREFLIKAVFDPNEVLEKVRRVLAGEVSTEAMRTTTMHGTAGTFEETIKVGVMPPVPVVVTPVAPVAPVTSPASGEKLFVMVVEDDKFLRELLVRKLLSEGFDVESAIEASAAFAILAQRKPNIILLDLILPGVDGFEILGRIKADPRIADVPVIILSNLGQKEDLDKAMALGAKDFMVKANFTLDEIVAKVHAFIG